MHSGCNFRHLLPIYGAAICGIFSIEGIFIRGGSSRWSNVGARTKPAGGEADARYKMSANHLYWSRAPSNAPPPPKKMEERQGELKDAAASADTNWTPIYKWGQRRDRVVLTVFVPCLQKEATSIDVDLIGDEDEDEDVVCRPVPSAPRKAQAKSRRRGSSLPAALYLSPWELPVIAVAIAYLAACPYN
jgi:hypothetical protein